MLQTPNRLEAGKPYPLGANWDGLGVNFAVFSAHAEKIELCLFDASGRHETARHVLPACTEEVWHGFLPYAGPGLLYGYRAHGPYDPGNGHRFNAAKLLLDPYSKAAAGDLRWTDALFGYRISSGRSDLSIDRRDSAGFIPKAIVVDDYFPWGDDKRPDTPWSETVIYEAHVRGMTKLSEHVGPAERGTIRALSSPFVIEHLLKLGVSAIELMPIHAFLQDRVLLEKRLGNYWGYNTLSFFAVEPRYLASGEPRELRELVRRYHAAGLEVVLDVVYNHTCEGNELGPTLSWRGLDNASYYRLADDKRHTINDTGTGNTLDLSHPRVLQMVFDSLRYWAESFHIDGFRFDLGLTLGREKWGFDTHSGFFDALRQDPVLSGLKLIAEPWDVGPGGYRLGQFPPGFAEWNDRYRDGLRKYWRGDGGMRPEVAARLTGSGDVFDTRKRKPWSSINYLASHDGFTLHDVVSYETKHNESTGEDNRDGQSENYSSNYGAEGPTEDEKVLAYREHVKRAMLIALLGSLGTPMLLMGDECGRTQDGNNNAYCHDDDLSWFDWKLPVTERGLALSAFLARLIEVRRRFATLRCARFLSDTSEIASGLKELSWHDERGTELAKDDWENPEGRALVLRRAARRDDGNIEITAVALNADNDELRFALPGSYPWRRLIDSTDPLAPEAPVEKYPYRIAGRGAAIFVAEWDAPA